MMSTLKCCSLHFEDFFSHLREVHYGQRSLLFHCVSTWYGIYIDRRLAQVTLVKPSILGTGSWDTDIRSLRLSFITSFSRTVFKFFLCLMHWAFLMQNNLLFLIFFLSSFTSRPLTTDNFFVHSLSFSLFVWFTLLFLIQSVVFFFLHIQYTFFYPFVFFSWFF